MRDLESNSRSPRTFGREAQHWKEGGSLCGRSWEAEAILARYQYEYEMDRSSPYS